MSDEAGDFEQQILTLLDDAGHRDNPLYEPLCEVFGRYREQIRLLDRITRISDRYQAAELEARENHIEFYRRKVRQAEKLIRISDQYQSMVREINEKLQHLSTHDELTGLPNRRCAQETLDRQIEAARAGNSALHVAMLDIDHFKSINDRYGHERGDEALIAIADCVRSCLRDADFCGRWGGEEFLLILPKTDAEGAGRVADRIRQTVAGLPALLLDNGGVRLTVSLGMTPLKPEDNNKTLVQRADHAMYQAKAQGRNRVVIAD